MKITNLKKECKRVMLVCLFLTGVLSGWAQTDMDKQDTPPRREDATTRTGSPSLSPNPGSIEINRHTTYRSYTPAQLVNNIFVKSGACSSVSNVTLKSHGWNGSSWSNATDYNNRGLGYFERGTADPVAFEMAEGLILATGALITMEGPNSSANGVSAPSGYATRDPDLELIDSRVANGTVSVLEFNFVPVNNVISFRYIFASEEYLEYANDIFNDVFGFFISGPGISGPYSNGGINIATLPNGLPVSINNINWGNTLAASHNCATTVGAGAQNPGYYTNIPGSYSTSCPVSNFPLSLQNLYQSMEFDGRTVVLTATCNVTPCATYHMKLAIANTQDTQFQSGVFLEAYSFDLTGDNIMNSGNNINGMDYVYRGCTNNKFTISRPVATASPLTVNLTYGGTAINGTDVSTYPGNTALPATVVIPANQTSVDVLYQANTPPTGSKTLTITTTCPCGGQAVTKTIYIFDRSPDPNLTATPVSACQGANNGRINLSFGSGGSGRYEWQLNGSSGWNSGFVNSLTGLAPGSYTIHLRDSGSCHTVTRTAVVGVHTANAGGNKTQCGNVFTMTGPGVQPPGYSGSWQLISGSASIANPNSGTTNVTVTTDTVRLRWVWTYSYSGTSCTAADTIRLVRLPRAIVSNATAAICTGNAFWATPTNGVNGAIVPANTRYTWTISNNTNITGQSAQSVPQTNISQTLTNSTTSAQTLVYTVTPRTAHGADTCLGANFTVTVTVNPRPVLSSAKTRTICSGISSTDTARSATSGTTFTWVRPMVTGISNAAGNGNTAIVTETLTNITVNPVQVRYIFTLTANSCSNTDTVFVTVNPRATISNTTAAICSGETFMVAPTHGVNGAIVPTNTRYTWTISTNNTNIAGQSAQPVPQNNISQTLTNNTANVQTLTYTVTPRTANGADTCLGANFTIIVTVNPIPVLSSSNTIPSICSGFPVIYTPTSATSGTTFTWARAVVPGIAEPANTGVAPINEVLTNTTSNPITVTYVITATTAANCTSTTNVTVIVTPTVTPSIIIEAEE